MDASMGAGNHPPLRKEVPLMKKLISILLAAMMLLTLALPVLAEEETPALGGETLGGWTVYSEDPTTIPEDVKACFDKALEGLVGCTYDPIALLATQVVSGTNYCLLCRCTVVTPDAPESFVMMYIYQSLEGECSILSIQDVVFDAGI